MRGSLMRTRRKLERFVVGAIGVLMAGAGICMAWLQHVGATNDGWAPVAVCTAFFGISVATLWAALFASDDTVEQASRGI